MAVRNGFCNEKSGWGAGKGKGWGEVATATGAPPPLISVEHTEKPAKIGAINATAQCFGPKDLVKTKLVKKACKKRMGRAF